MLTVERCRRIMPEATQNLSDEEVAALCQYYELFACIAIETTLREQISDSPEQNGR
jgi:cytochrome c553